jgi:3-mercaptopyruvate sulfurtransferase SseA
VGIRQRRIRLALSEYLLSGSVAEFRRRGRKLSKQHRKKISESLKQRNQGAKQNRQQRILAIRESEARSRNLRNIGYITNSISDGVREARLTARYFGIDPSRRRSARSPGRILGIADVSSGQAARTTRNIGYIARTVLR